MNGRAFFNMLLDTGVDPSIVDLHAARDLKVKTDPVGHQGSGGGSDSNLAYETKLLTLERP